MLLNSYRPRSAGQPTLESQSQPHSPSAFSPSPSPTPSSSQYNITRDTMNGVRHPPRSILKRRRCEELSNDTCVGQFASPLATSSDCDPASGSSKRLIRSVRLRVPKKPRNLTLSLEQTPTKAQLREQQEASEPQSNDYMETEDFDVYELEPMSEVSSASSKEYFGIRPSPHQLERSEKQLAAQQHRRETPGDGKVRIIQGNTSLRYGYGRYGSATNTGFHSRLSNPPPIRRMSAGGFRISSSPPRRELSRKESGLIERLLKENEERRREAEELKEIQRESLITEPVPIIRSNNRFSPTPTRPCYDSPVIDRLTSSPTSSSSTPSPLSPSPTMSSSPLHSLAEDDVFSPNSGESSADEIICEQSSDEEANMLADDQHTGELPNDPPQQKPALAVTPEPHLQIEDSDGPPYLSRCSSPTSSESPRTPRKSFTTPIAPFSQSPLLHAPKKKRDQGGSPIASPMQSRETHTHANTVPSTPSRSPRRSLASQMAQLPTEAESQSTATNVPVSPLKFEAGANPVQALLASIQQDAKDCILHNGRIYVPLPFDVPEIITQAQPPAKVAPLPTPAIQVSSVAPTATVSSQSTSSPFSPSISAISPSSSIRESLSPSLSSTLSIAELSPPIRTSPVKRLVSNAKLDRHSPNQRSHSTPVKCESVASLTERDAPSSNSHRSSARKSRSNELRSLSDSLSHVFNIDHDTKQRKLRANNNSEPVKEKKSLRRDGSVRANEEKSGNEHTVKTKVHHVNGPKPKRPTCIGLSLAHLPFQPLPPTTPTSSSSSSLSSSDSSVFVSPSVLPSSRSSRLPREIRGLRDALSVHEC